MLTIRTFYAGRVLAWLSLLVVGAAPLLAQGTDASIQGIVRDSAGSVLADADVEARHLGTGFAASVRTDARGRFTLLQLPLGGPWRLTARRIGFRPAVRELAPLRLGGTVDVTIALTPSVVQLEALEVVGDTAFERRAARLGGSTRIDEEVIARVPAVNRSYTDLAALAPTVGPQLAVGGGRFTATDFRIDGAQSRNMLRAGEAAGGPYSISLEAIAAFEVNSNVYDVAQGRGGGGTVSTVTRSGGNAWSGSAFAYNRNDALSAPEDFQGRPRELRQFDFSQYGGSVGGPIVRDRLHFFGAIDRQDGSEPVYIALLRTPDDEIAAGASADSIARLESILKATYGTPPGQAQTGVFPRQPDATTALARLDWRLSGRSRLTLRYNYSDFANPLGGGVDQPIAFYEARSDFRSFEHQALASLQSRYPSGAQNDLSVGYNRSGRRLTALNDIPRGFVRIRSTLDNGTTGDARVQFGGNRLAPDVSDEGQFQLQDRLTLPRGPLLLTFGTDNAVTHLSTLIAVEQGGLFEFNSLADLEAQRAFRYTRSVPTAGASPTTEQTVLDLGLFAQADWRLRDDLAVSMGLRWDATSFLTAAAYNPAVEEAFGLRTDTRPEDWLNFQPRAQVVWTPTSGDIVRIGGGLFTSQAPYYVQHNTLLNTGLSLADVSYSGTAVPVADFPDYRNDPATVPGVIPPATAVPFVNLVSPEWRLPTTWKLSAAWERPLAGWLSLSASALGSWTHDNYYYVDRNLKDAQFTLDAEQGRPVFVPASTIDAQGRTNVRDALANPQFGRVLELVSIAGARAISAILEATARYGRDGFASVSYAWSDAKDNSSFGCCLARTATTFTPVQGDPRDIETSWGPADLAVHHKLVVTAGSPTVAGFQVTARYVGSTGRPFSLVVNGDINGDEATANDLAFIFDPDAPDTPDAIAEGMRAVLGNEQNRARDYIAEHLGQIAGRNAIFAPWTGRLDLRVTKAISTWQGQSLELSLDVFNFLNLLNDDWGGQNLLPAGISAQNPVLQRQTLLNVTGFDPVTRRYGYSVNENVGVLQRGGDPWIMQLGVRYRF